MQVNPPIDTTQEPAAKLNLLATALSKTQSEISFASKDSTNPAFRSKYADLASVWDAIREPMTKNGLAVVQLPSTDGAKVTVTTLLLHTSGQFIESALTMTAADTKPQTIGSTVTYARRYALSAVLGVAPDDDDGNAASGRDDGPKQAVSKPAASNPFQIPGARK